MMAGYLHYLQHWPQFLSLPNCSRGLLHSLLLQV